MKRLTSIGLCACLSGMFLVGCGSAATEPVDTGGTTGPQVETGLIKEFDYTNKHGETFHCIIENENYNSAVMSCVVSTPTPTTNNGG